MSPTALTAAPAAIAPPALNAEDAIGGAVGPWDWNCAGYGTPGASGAGYLAVITLATGVAPAGLGDMLDEIRAFDVAEVKAKLPQINATPVTSFCGPAGHIWGLSAASNPGLPGERDVAMSWRMRHDGTQIPVFTLTPLLEAGAALLEAFPILEGSHTPCALRTVTAKGPRLVGAVLGVGIAADRNRAASLFMEDVIDTPCPTAPARPAGSFHFRDRLAAVADSIIAIGENLGVLYSKIFVGVTSEWVPPGSVGCGLVCIPYLTLAKKAVPEPARLLLDMSLPQWHQLARRQALRAGA
jgi:histidine decarboxylase